MGAAAPSDYRPITMIHSFAKLVSKILALRLAPKLNDLVDTNQNAFIRNRTIQDNFKYIQRAAVLIRKRKVPMLLLKLDISKAFDTLSWPFLLDILSARRFGRGGAGGSPHYCPQRHRGSSSMDTRDHQSSTSGEFGRGTHYPPCSSSSPWMSYTECL